ncbi:hypothetical protein [Aquihabitans sp. McL0605]|uniref:hypothetical protein n=1 Tax=Aquihabitans sp. McL0605 TaxID=3415671 RepID=UPI003CF1E687
MDTLSDFEMETPRQRWSQLWPFMLAFVLGFALAWLAPQGPENVTYMVVVGVIIVAVAASILRWSWSSVPDILTLLPVAALCVAVDLMRAASGGGSSAGYGSLLLIPVIWQAMRRGQRELVLTIVLVSIANVVG